MINNREALIKSKVELKPCPLCGCRADLYKSMNAFSVRCFVCGCRSGYWFTEDAVVKNWNNRIEK